MAWPGAIYQLLLLLSDDHRNTFSSMDDLLIRLVLQLLPSPIINSTTIHRRVREFTLPQETSEMWCEEILV